MSNTRFPAISLWQPWASLIEARVKTFETRSWPPPARLIGQRIAIHAAKKQVSVRDLTEELHEACLDEFGCSYNYTLPRGAIVCTAVLAGAYPLDDESADGRHVAVRSRLAGSPALDCIAIDAFGDYSRGRWAWRLTGVEPVSPAVPWRGSQGFFTVDFEAALCRTRARLPPGGGCAAHGV